MNRRWGLPIVLVAASAALAADAKKPASSPPPGRIPRTAEFVERVNGAIDRGVESLKRMQGANGAWADYPGFPGATTALSYYTMRVCGVSRDDPAAKSAWDALRRDYRKTDLRTYSAAIYLMAITEHGDEVESVKEDRDVRLSVDEKAWATEIARALAGGQDEQGCWSYLVEMNATNVGSGVAGMRAGGPFDHSNTQYALLGLKCAARCGVPIDRSVWRKSLAHFLDTQESSGPDVPRFVNSADASVKGRTSAGGAVVDHARGWGYRDASEVVKKNARAMPSYPSMTAAGVSSVVICRSELMGFHEMTPKLEAESEKSAWDGLAWLGRNWDPSGVPMNPGVRRGGIGLNLYEYYGVERAGVLAAVEWMASLDWYGAGAARILDAQAQDGSWPGQYGRVAVDPRNRLLQGSGGDAIDTSFALLFLKKGTTPVRMGAVTQIGGDTDINFAEAAKASGKDLEDVLDLVLVRWRRTSDDKLRARLFDGATSVGPRIVEPLLVRMDSSEFQKRSCAHELLKRATGLDFGWCADAEPAARDDAVLKWQTWWMGAKDRVEYDAASKRLVVR